MAQLIRTYARQELYAHLPAWRIWASEAPSVAIAVPAPMPRLCDVYLCFPWPKYAKTALRSF